MAYGEVNGMSTESASYSYGQDPAPCKKSTFVIGTINAPPTGNATIDIKAQSFCDCGGMHRASSCSNKEYGSPTKVCRTTHDRLGRDVEECVNVHLTKGPANLGIPSGFCVEQLPYPEDMGTCPKPPGKVSCECESDGQETFTDSRPTSDLVGAGGANVIRYVGNGKPRQVMDAADCGSCDA